MRRTLDHQCLCGGTHRRAESGQVFVWATVLLPILLIAAGLTFDVGNMINIRDELTDSVDAAALAATEALHDTKASESYVRSCAKEVAAQNQVPSLGKNAKGNAVTLALNATNAAGGDIVLGKYDFTTKTFTRATSPVDLSKANAVQINARLSQAAGSLPLSFGGVVGFTSFDTVRTALAVIGSSVKLQPNIPIAVNKDVFTGKAKGFTAPDDIILSTKSLNDMMWTGFFTAANTSNVQGYVANQPSIPTLQVGDVLQTSTANEGANYKDMAANYKPNDIILVPVVAFDNANASKSTGTVVGFSSIRIDGIYDQGSPKYIDGTVVSYKTGKSDPTTTAECYGVDCRSFLVN